MREPEDVTVLQEYNTNLETLSQGILLLILSISIVLSNVLIIGTIVNFRGNLLIALEKLYLVFSNLSCRNESFSH